MILSIWAVILFFGRTLCDNGEMTRSAVGDYKSVVDNCTGAPESEVAARKPGSGVGTAVKVQFGPIPKNKLYLSTLSVQPSFNPYYHIKDFLHIIHPSPFPIDLLRAVLKDSDSNGPGILKMVELEIGFVGILFLSILFSMAIPGMVLSLCSKEREPPPSCAPNCKRKTLVFVLHIFLSLLLLGSGGMLWSNEECSQGVASSPNFVSEVIDDSKTFLEDSVNKLQYLLGEAFDQAAFSANKDLQDAENLLGRPIQVELVLETGLDVALDSLFSIAAGAKEVCAQVAGIMQVSSDAEHLALLARSKFEDLKTQLDSVKRHCRGRDKPLCDSIPSRLLEVKFSTKMITNNSQLEFLKQAGVDSLASSVAEANAVFTALPLKIDQETTAARQAVSSEVLLKKGELATSALILDQVKSRSKMKLLDLKATVVPHFESLSKMEYWRWITGLVAGLTVVYIWALLVGATCCGCCGAERSSTPTIIVALIILCLSSVILWFLSFVTLYLGGHGENHICRILSEIDENNDHPFARMSDIVDIMGAAYDGVDESRSYIADLIMNNSTSPLSINQVLRSCEGGKSTYYTFNLRALVNVEKAVDVNSWANICNNLRGVHVNLAQIQLFGSPLNLRLEELQRGLMINVSQIRSQMTGPVSSDLEALSNLLNDISKQLTDSASSVYLRTIAAKSRTTLETVIEDLENHKENLIYHLTALELKINPLLYKLNQSIAHIKAVQFYINNHGMTLARQNVDTYVTRIKNYFDQYQHFVLTSINDESTSCRPFWEMFYSFKQLVCRRTLDPLNGFWFSTIYCLLLLIIITPICLKLINYFKSNTEVTGMSPPPREPNW